MDERSRVLGHRMTSQCASGSGQFLENIARYLGIALEDVGRLSTEGTAPETVSGICAVLAETDVINMVSRGVEVRNILKGIHASMATRFVRLLLTAEASGVVVIRRYARPPGRSMSRTSSAEAETTPTTQSTHSSSHRPQNSRAAS